MKWASWLFLSLLAGHALPLLAEPELLEAVSNRLETTTQLQRRFEQEKSLPFLNRPLISSGEFTISREQGLIWRVTDPVVSEMTVDTSGVRLDGRRIDDAGTGALIASLMQAFMTGDLSEIQRKFNITGNSGEDSWHLVLTPRSIFLRSALKHIEVDGSRSLRQVIITEASGSKSKIRLFELAPVGISAPDLSGSIE